MPTYQTIHVHHRHGGTVAEVPFEKCFGGEESLRSDFQQLALEPSEVLLLDLRRIKYCGSTFLGQVIKILQARQGRTVPLRLSVSADLFELLTITHLYLLFELCDDFDAESLLPIVTVSWRQLPVGRAVQLSLDSLQFEGRWLAGREVSAEFLAAIASGAPVEVELDLFSLSRWRATLVEWAPAERHKALPRWQVIHADREQILLQTPPPVEPSPSLSPPVSFARRLGRGVRRLLRKLHVPDRRPRSQGETRPFSHGDE